MVRELLTEESWIVKCIQETDKEIERKRRKKAHYLGKLHDKWGLSWREIGEALGISGQAAWEFWNRYYGDESGDV